MYLFRIVRQARQIDEDVITMVFEFIHSLDSSQTPLDTQKLIDRLCAALNAEFTEWRRYGHDDHFRMETKTHGQVLVGPAYASDTTLRNIWTHPYDKFYGPWTFIGYHLSGFIKTPRNIDIENHSQPDDR